MLADRVVIIDSVPTNRRNRSLKPFVRANQAIQTTSSKPPLRSRGTVSKIIKNIWRWIRYYRRRKKIHLRDGTVLIPTIRLYDLLDFADGDEDARRRLR